MQVMLSTRHSSNGRGYDIHNCLFGVQESNDEGSNPCISFNFYHLCCFFVISLFVCLFLFWLFLMLVVVLHQCFFFFFFFFFFFSNMSMFFFSSSYFIYFSYTFKIHLSVFCIFIQITDWQTKSKNQNTKQVGFFKKKP